MNVPQLQINQGYSQIGLQSTKGELRIEQPEASMTIQQERGQLDIQTQEGSLQIDSRRAWSALGRANFAELTDRIAQGSLQMSYQAIAKTVDDGNRMMATHEEGNPFAEIAREVVFEDHSINICGEARFDNVDVQYTPAQVKQDYTPGDVSIQVEMNKPRIDYYPGKVNPYLIQKNYIFMTSNGRSLDAIF